MHLDLARILLSCPRVTRVTAPAAVLGLVAAFTLPSCGEPDEAAVEQAGGTAGSGTAGSGTAGASGAPGTALSASAGAGGAAGEVEVGLPTRFQWTSTGPLVSPIPDDSHPILSVKDPSVVFFEDRWHVFATTASSAATWSMIYLSFSDWSEAADAQPYYLDNNPALRGYHAAPQVFYFSPQDRWYLIFQSGQPQYSTTDDLSAPETWSSPKNFFAAEPAIVAENKGSGGWLDFWVICDDNRCHLFFTDDNGHLYRSDTSIQDFPEGFGDPVIAIEGTKETLFEGSATYRVRGTGGYLTLVEAFGTMGERYYRSFVADTLEGEWSPLAATPEDPFAGRANVGFGDGAAWTLDISHGELLRDGYDESLTIDPSNLRFLYQGMDPSQGSVEYYQRPYRLALLTFAEEPIEGAGDTPELPPACEGSTVAGSEHVADFEDGTVSGWWDSYDDTSTGAHTPLAAEQSGANDTAYALHFSGTGYESWGANVGTTLGCTDTSAFDGISFYARGTSGTDDVLQVIAQVPAAQPVGSGGDCLADCYSHPRAPIVLTPEWVHYAVPFAALEHPGWGVSAPYEGVVMGFAFESAGPDFDVWVDELTLYSDAPPAGGGGAGGGMSGGGGAGGGGGAAGGG